MTDMTSTLYGSSDEIRRQISEQRADAEIAQGALLTLLCDHYDSMLEQLGGQIDTNTCAIEGLEEKIEKITSTGESTTRYRPGREYRELRPDEKERIAKLIASNRVTPIGLAGQNPSQDEFDKLDQMAAQGKLDADGKTSN